MNGDARLGATRPQACHIIGVTRAKLNQLIENGELRLVTRGRYRRILVGSLIDYIARQHRADPAYFAKQLVLNCVRNTQLEDLHAGFFPRSKTGDYSDVKVVTPYGEIPWTNVSRISDEEMKSLMKEIVNKVFTVLSLSPEQVVLRAAPEKWDDPVLEDGFSRAKLDHMIEDFLNKIGGATDGTEH